MEPDTEHRQCPHKGEEPHDYPDNEDRWEAVDEEAKSLQLHQVPVPGSTAAVTFGDTYLKPFKPDYLSRCTGFWDKRRTQN
jgi:hypothetical protein